MEDFLVALASGIADLLVEVFLQMVMGALADFVVRWSRNGSSKATFWNPVVAAVGIFVAGLLSGVLSVAVAPHPLVRPSKFHGISLLISPLITGIIMAQIGTWVRKRGLRAVQIESFAYGFMFALGIAIVRFLWLR